MEDNKTRQKGISKDKIVRQKSVLEQTGSLEDNITRQEEAIERTTDETVLNRTDAYQQNRIIPLSVCVFVEH